MDQEKMLQEILRFEKELATLQARHNRLEGFVQKLALHANIPLEY